MPQQQGQTKERARSELREPPRYNVIMHNDDFTTMEFVVEILISVFKKNPQEAEALMLTVHKSGRAVVGSYPYDIAVTKVNIATARARQAGYPFKMTVEEA